MQHCVSGKEEPFIEAHGLTLRTVVGAPYVDVDLTAPDNSLIAIRGRHGSGKTPLLLTLAGRMKFNQGTLMVGGYDLPQERRHVARMSGLSLFEGLNDLEVNIPCGIVLRSELELYGKPHKKQHVTRYLETWQLGHIEDQLVRDISQFDLVMFGIALGMANDPKMLIVDNIEDQLTLNQTHEILDRLLMLAHEYHKVVVVGCTEKSVAESADCVYSLTKEESSYGR